MKQVYAGSFAFLRGSAFALLVMAAIIEVLVFFLPGSSSAGVAVGLAFIAYAMHRYFLFGEILQFKPQTHAPKMKAGLFVVFSLGTYFVVLMVMIVIGFSSPNAARDLSVERALVWSFGLSCLLAGFLGTLLPWSVDRDRRYSVLNGIKTAPVTFMRLVMGPAVALIVVFVIVILIEQIMPELPTMAELGVMTVYRFLGFIPMVLTAAVLCKSYTEALTRVPDNA